MILGVRGKLSLFHSPDSRVSWDQLQTGDAMAQLEATQVLDLAFEIRSYLCQHRIKLDRRLPHGFGDNTAHVVVILHWSVMILVAAFGDKLCMH